MIINKYHSAQCNIEINMTNHNFELGRLGEEIAVEYFKKQKFQVLYTNYRSSNFEIDIVLRDSFCVRFVEVKTRLEGSVDTISGSLNRKKISTLTRAIYNFMSTHHDLNGLDMFLDLVIVVMSSYGSHSFEYIPAFTQV